MDELLNTPIARYTTLKVGGDVRRLVHPTSTDEVVEVMSQLRESGEAWFVLGGGSNLLVSSEGFDGTVIRMTQMQRLEKVGEDIIEADAGVRLPHLAKYAAAHGLSGLEFAVGIPGTVGGGAVMNAGAHGSSISEVTADVTVFDTKEWKVVTLSGTDLGFEYRRSAIDPDRHIVLSSRYKLKPDVAENIMAKTKHNEDYRWQTQPIGTPNAGSTFKNPEPTRTAGFLLDQAGAKNLRVGNAGVSAIHANFVINLGGATSQDITSLLREMQNIVQAKFDVRMHPEWKRLGKFTDEELEVWS